MALDVVYWMTRSASVSLPWELVFIMSSTAVIALRRRLDGAVAVCEDEDLFAVRFADVLRTLMLSLGVPPCSMAC